WNEFKKEISGNYQIRKANEEFKNIEILHSIPDNVTFHIDEMEVEGKVSRKLDDSKKIWNEFKKEISGNYQIRKANEEFKNIEILHSIPD
ncbi:hypothetical protein, partial [Chryseobacterium sp. CH1]|uniref:hypothetical protein n=1 Tax=Chryseobacterium sp. CH1 TaxID=713551 RepID=UPI0010280FB2